jgi:hypothetical protein
MSEYCKCYAFIIAKKLYILKLGLERAAKVMYISELISPKVMIEIETFSLSLLLL